MLNLEQLEVSLQVDLVIEQASFGTITRRRLSTMVVGLNQWGFERLIELR
jgi:hypothetical protein